MSRLRATILLGLVAISVTVVARGKPTTSGGFTELHRVELADATGLEVVMGLVERSGESTSPKHYHPGGEFGFLLEGEVTITTESESPVTLKAGTSFYQPPGGWHVVSTNATGARTVVVRVLKKGQPMIVVVD
jgi:quercetin dioxygenase-like cupin family protein